MFGEQCTKLTTCTQVLPLEQEVNTLEFMELKECLRKGNYSNCSCCKPNSPVHVFVIVNAINQGLIQGGGVDWVSSYPPMG